MKNHSYHQCMLATAMAKKNTITDFYEAMLGEAPRAIQRRRECHIKNEDTAENPRGECGANATYLLWRKESCVVYAACPVHREDLWNSVVKEYGGTQNVCRMHYTRPPVNQN